MQYVTVLVPAPDNINYNLHYNELDLVPTSRLVGPASIQRISFYWSSNEEKNTTVMLNLVLELNSVEYALFEFFAEGEKVRISWRLRGVYWRIRRHKWSLR